MGGFTVRFVLHGVADDAPAYEVLHRSAVACGFVRSGAGRAQYEYAGPKAASWVVRAAESAARFTGLAYAVVVSGPSLWVARGEAR